MCLLGSMLLTLHLLHFKIQSFWLTFSECHLTWFSIYNEPFQKTIISLLSLICC